MCLISHERKKQTIIRMWQTVEEQTEANLKKNAKYDWWRDSFLGRGFQSAQKYWVLHGRMPGPKDGVWCTVMDELMSKVTVWMCFFSLHGWHKTFVMGNGSIDGFDCLSQYHSIQWVNGCKLSSHRSQFWSDLASAQINWRPLTLRAEENTRSGKGDHTKTAAIQIRPLELFCAPLVLRVYTKDFKTETKKQLSTQIHCQKCRLSWPYS